MEQLAFHILKTNVIAALFIILVQVLARFIKGKYSSMWKYFMWLAISVFLLIPVNPFNRISALQLQIKPPAAYAPYNSVQSASVLSEADLPDTSAADSKTAFTPGSSAVNHEESSDLYSEVRSARRNVILSSSKVSLYGFLQFFFVIWIAIVLVLTLYKTLLYRFSIGHLMRWSMPVKDKKILELYRFCCLKKHIARPPKLMVGTRLSSPVLAGMRETRLYLPSEDYSMEELQLVFYHELSHYKCHDLWYRMLLLAVTTIYWFNPFLYQMKKEAEKDIENLCDSSVIKFCEKPERLAYSRLLLKTATFQNHVPYLSTSLNDSALVFKERILYMMSASAMNSHLTPAILLTIALVLVHTGIGCTIGDAPLLPRTDYSDSIIPVNESKKSAGIETSSAIFGSYDMLPAKTDAPLESSPADQTLLSTNDDSENHDFSVTASSKTIYATGTVNIRSGAGTQFPVIGTAIDKMQFTQTGVSNNGWIQIDWNGTTAYVSQDFVTETPPSENQVQTLSGSGEIIGTITSISRNSFSNTQVTVQAQNGNTYSFASNYETTYLDQEVQTGSLVKIRYRDSVLCQMFSQVDPNNIQETFTEIGQVTEIQNDMTLFIQNTETGSGSARNYFIGHLNGPADYTVGDYVMVTYAGDYNNPYVLDVEKQNTDPVFVSPDAAQDSFNDTAPEETADTPILLYDGTFREPVQFDDQGNHMGYADYYTVQVANVSKSSFDFSIVQCDYTGAAKSSEVSGTALFTGDTSAEYSGNGYTLYFSLTGPLPVITHMNVSGYEPLNGLQLYNNHVPGYGFN